MQSDIIPIFPLPLVLFPGAPQLLHIFEPRYRQMLDDCLAGERRFGISYVDPRSGQTEPRIGQAGCQTVIESVHKIPDGRSNIVCLGEKRYVLEEYVATDRMYHVARIRHFDDEPESPGDLDELADRVYQVFKEVAAGNWATHIHQGDPPDDPKDFSYWAAGGIEIGPAERQALLEMRSTDGRLRAILTHLEEAHDALEAEIGAGLRGRRNGNPHKDAPTSSES